MDQEIKGSPEQVQIVIDDEFLKKRPLSASSLKEFRKSPKHYIEYLFKTWKPKDEFTIGKAFEALILEPELFNTKFQVYKNFEKRTNEAKAKWQKMLADAKASKVELITEENFALASRMSESVLANPNCREWVEKRTNVQRKVFWKHSKTGLPVIGFTDFDVEEEGKVTIVDVKSDYNGEPQDWFRHAGKLDYLTQVGSYLLGYWKAFYSLNVEFKFLVCEKSSPFNCYMVNCDAKYMNEAKEEFKNTLLAFRYCMDNDLFHMGYDFWLFDTKSYFTMEKPRYIKSKFSQ